MTVDVVTFGCRLNTFESEVIRREAEEGAELAVGDGEVKAEVVELPFRV